MPAMFGLYYPHVRFRDERWLKTTALYWDRMYRLFPNGEYYDSVPNVSSVEEAFTDAGFVKEAHPEDEARRRAAKIFAGILGSLDLEQYRLAIERFDDLQHAIAARDQQATFSAVLDAAYAAGWEKLLDYVADWKLESGYLAELIEQRLAIRNPTTWDTGRLWMHPTLAHAYLLVLGMDLANDYGASAVSDEEIHHSAGGQDLRKLVATCLADGTAAPSVEPGQHEAILINLAVATVLPRDLDAVHPEQIIRFRERYAGERLRFRREVDELLNGAVELDRIRDRSVLIDHLQARYDTELKPALEDLRRALRGGGIETALSAMDLQVAVPTAAATGLAELAVHPAAPVAVALGGAGFAIGLWKTAIRRRRQRSATLADSPVAYLHHLQTDLAPVPLVERVRKAVARITPG